MLTLLLFVAGCAHYEFDLTHPPEMATHIGTQSDAVVDPAPMQYRMRADENHLVVRVLNPTEDPIRLVGDQSSVVDPSEQSHALRSGTIESHSFVQLVLPPEPYLADAGAPEMDYAISAAETNAPRVELTAYYGHPYCRPFYGGAYFYGYRGYYPYYPWFYGYGYWPRYYVYYDGGGWDWKGGSDVRLALTFERNGKTFRDEFTFKRVQVK